MNQIKDLKKDLKRLASLLDRHTVSQSISDLVPDAYANGKARVRFASRFPHKERQDFSVTINDTHVFEAVNIPDSIWNDHLRRKES